MPAIKSRWRVPEAMLTFINSKTIVGIVITYTTFKRGKQITKLDVTPWRAPPSNATKLNRAPRTRENSHDSNISTRQPVVECYNNCCIKCPIQVEINDKNKHNRLRPAPGRTSGILLDLTQRHRRTPRGKPSINRRK